ncbi:MAG: cyclase [Chloroflexi bacterium]|nr:MAG: cyclase [Chloroflexota bacterium]
MKTIEKSITVDVPVRTTYNQWTQFEDFPRFMEGVEQVQQRGDKYTHWRANIGGKTEEWDAEIIEQTPDQRVAWRSTTGSYNAGTVSFQPMGANQTRLTLRLDYEPEGAVENVGDALGFVERRVEGDLERFKEFIESRGAETGAWRGEIHGAQVERGGQGH